MAMYSAALSQHVGSLPFWRRALIAYTLTDQTFGVAINRFEREPAASPGWKVAYYLGVSVPVCGPWYLATWLGAVAGGAIPEGLALDFAVPITFLALVGPGLRSVPHLAAATVSVVVSLALAWLPYNLWLLVAAVLAMATGAFVETRLEGRR
jgi:predicted branched-subunit amino acid permease